MKTARKLNHLIARLGAPVAIMIIIMIGLGGGFFVRNVITDVEAQSAAFSSQRMREGFVAMSDIHRLVFTLDHQYGPSSAREFDVSGFEESLDILYVRYLSFGRWLDQDLALGRALDAQSAIRAVLDIGDEILANGLTEPESQRRQLLAAANDARGAVIGYIDETRRVQEQALHEQSKTLFLLQNILQVALLFTSAIGVSAILLLHREIATRKEREQAERKAEYLAYNDPLTGLANRLRFNEHLAHLMDTSRSLAVVFLDLDDFKGINDTYGHGFGDVVLAEVANRLSDVATRYGGLAVRLGGDEFGALLTTENHTKLTYLCKEILESCAKPIVDEGVAIQCGVSLGVATSGEAGGGGTLTAEKMARAADFALYESKAAGRGTFTIYDKKLDERYLAHRDLLDAIPAAIENNEFFVTYQPKVHLDGLQIYGFEALIRWRRDGRVVAPGDFLPVAEEARQIIKLDHFVLADATRQVAIWNDQHNTSLGLSVNLSALHFEDFRIVEEVKFALARSGLEPHLLTLELTETVLLQDWDQVHELLGLLRALGCKISLDDFGTGYSSLAYLRRIKADELKIDRSFVVDIESSQETAFILDAVVDIAQSLGMLIVVEGIENEAQAQIVAGYGCDLGQGYYFGAPVDARLTEQTFLAEAGNHAGFSLPAATTGREWLGGGAKRA